MMVLGLKSVYLWCFYDFPLLFKVFINIHEYPKYPIWIICIADIKMKGLCPRINLVPSLVV